MVDHDEARHNEESAARFNKTFAADTQGEESVVKGAEMLKYMRSHTTFLVKKSHRTARATRAALA